MQETDIMERIKALCSARSWTFYRLAKESDITYSTLCTMFHKSTAPSIPTLVKLCRGFNISLSEFFDTNNDWSTLTPTQKNHLTQWDALDAKNKLATEKYIQFLLAEQQKDGQEHG